MDLVFSHFFSFQFSSAHWIIFVTSGSHFLICLGVFHFWIYPQMSGHPWLCLHIWKCISNSWLEIPVHGQGLSLAGLHWEGDELTNLPTGTRGGSVIPDVHLPTFPRACRRAVYIHVGVWSRVVYIYVCAGVQAPGQKWRQGWEITMM